MRALSGQEDPVESGASARVKAGATGVSDIPVRQVSQIFRHDGKIHT